MTLDSILSGDVHRRKASSNGAEASSFWRVIPVRHCYNVHVVDAIPGGEKYGTSTLRQQYYLLKNEIGTMMPTPFSLHSVRRI